MLGVFVFTSPLATCSCKVTCLRCWSVCDVDCCCRSGVLWFVVAVRVFAGEDYAGGG